MNSNFGILPTIEGRHPKKMNKQLKAERARKAMEGFVGRGLGSFDKLRMGGLGVGARTPYSTPHARASVMAISMSPIGLMWTPSVVKWRS